MFLYCIRHGQSEYNAENRIQGQLDPDLSELGRSQAAAMATAVAELALDAIYASPQQRALNTARALAEQVDLPITTDLRLREIHVGKFQGHSWDEIGEKYPEDYARWCSGDPDFVVPGGESRRMLLQRGQEVLAEIRQRDHQRVAVVSHGGLLMAGLKAVLGMPVERYPFKLQNCSITRLDWQNEADPRLVSLNEVHHLAECGLGPEGPW